MTMYRYAILLLCSLSVIKAAVVQSDDPKYQTLVDMAAEDVAQGKQYKVVGVFESANGDKENEYTVKLEFQDPERLCESSILDSQPTDENSQAPVQYSLLKTECKEPVQETLQRKTVPRLCAGCPVKHDPNDPEAQAAARFALSHYNSELGEEDKLTEVRIAEVKTQVVNGVNYIMVLEFMKDGELIQRCDATVWVKAYMNFRKVTKINCSPASARDGREVFGKEHEIEDVNQKFVQNVVKHAIDALNDIYQASYVKKQSKRVVKASLKQTVTGPLYEFVLDVDSMECLRPWNDDETCDEDAKYVSGESCTLLVADQSRLHRQKPFKVVQSHCTQDLNSIYPLNRKKRSSRIGGHRDYNLNVNEELTEFSMSQLEYQMNTDHLLKVVKVLESKVQIVSGKNYHLTLEIGVTKCHRNSVQRRSDCEIDEEKPHQVCKVEIWEKPWMRFRKLTNYTCTDHKYPENFWESLSPQDTLVAEKFKAWMFENDKVYSSEKEHQRRFSIFKENMGKIRLLQKTEQGTATYGPTKFADLTSEEFKKYSLGFRPSKESYKPPKPARIPEIELPESWDWRTYNVVTSVKDQGFCGSCWAFSVTGNIEGQYGVHQQKLYDLSEQELLDCDKVDDGCQGGYMLDAYKAVMKLGGLETERAYPYRAHQQDCHFNQSMVKVSIKSSVNITKNETGMAKWLVKNGPISIGINANAMQFYFGGVSHPWKILCDPENIDHGVLLVGYGVHTSRFLKKQVPYWIVKNSWGAGWGEQGYYRVFRGDGTCGVNQYATSAIV